MLSVSVLLHMMLAGVYARLANVTIDDQYGDAQNGRLVKYQGDKTWTEWSKGSSNTGTFVPSDGPVISWGQVHNGTIHFSQSDASTIHLSFIGSAIYIFFVLLSTRPTSLTFTVDGIAASNLFSHLPAGPFEAFGSSLYTYDNLVFVRDDLDNGPHDVVVSNVRATGEDTGVAMFDYAVYSTDLDHQGAAPSLKQRVSIISSSIAVVLLVSAAGVIWFLCRRKRHRSSGSQPSTTAWINDRSDPDPYPVEFHRSGKAIFEKPRTELVAKIQFEKVPADPRRATQIFVDEPEPARASRARNDDAALLRAELERVLEENEILRQTSAPPPEYSQGTGRAHA